MSQFEDAVQAARQGLSFLGVSLPAQQEEIDQRIGAGIGMMQGHLAQVTVEGLIALPAMTNPAHLMTMRLLF